MRHNTLGFAWAGIAALMLAACGGSSSVSGGGSSSSSSGGGANIPPTANAGTNQSVTSGVTVTLNGSASSDPDGTIALYNWTQTAGVPPLTLTNPLTAQPTFVAPAVAAATVFTFSLTVADNSAATSSASTVNITVNPPVAGMANVTGHVTFARVPFTSSTPFKLDYANATQRPARGILVRAINAANQTPVPGGEGSTNGAGDYSLAVPANTNVTIQVIARLERDSPLPLPRWDVSVGDGVGANPYTFTLGTIVNSGPVGATHDIAIPLNINTSGNDTGVRASGPFAILDTIYQSIEKVREVSPTIDLPALSVDWGSQTEGTFFSADANDQFIALLSDLTEDTDEFDQHVVAHEFGHYIEFNFSRADNIGGQHGPGNRLDPRVAFGEGFGYAFAAIVLNDPIAHDSFIGTSGSGDLRASSFNIETNPGTLTPVPGSGDQTGCWCSESSVWSLLWDVYDTEADTNDNIAIGFQPIWTVLVGAQRTTPSITSIFSFVTALKAARPGDSAAINTLVSAQNIDSASIDAFGTGETHRPSQVPAAAALPVFTTISVPGGPVVLRTVDDPGRYNKLGNHRFLRFTLASTRTTTVTLTTSNPNTATADPDFLLYRQGSIMGGNGAGQGPPTGSGSETFMYSNLPAGDYVLDVYDCANGCGAEEGAPGDYDLTVTIN